MYYCPKVLLNNRFYHPPTRKDSLNRMIIKPIMDNSHFHKMNSIVFESEERDRRRAANTLF